jgi:MFS family permease
VAEASSAAAGFFGWRMVGVAFLVDFIAVGFFFYSFGIFYPAIHADFPGSSFGVAAGISISNLVGGLFAPFIGRALDRHRLERMMVLGAVMVSAGFFGLSRITALWQYYLVLGTFFAFGLGMMGGMASAKLVANWFESRRGSALGLATMGVSLSGLVMPTLATWLVSGLGWRGGFSVYSLGILAIVVPVVALTVVSRPEDVGQRPDGAAPEPDPPPGGPLPSVVYWETRRILAARNFWVIALPFAAVFSSLSAILIHVVAYAHDLGIAGYRAGSILSASAGAGALGKLVFGQLVDRIDARVAVWTSFGAQLVGLLVMMQGSSYPLLLAGGAVFGFGMGGVVPLQSALCGMAFGRLSFGQVLGLMRPVQVPLHALGIPLAAWIHDATGSYAIVFRIFLGVYVVSAVAIGALRLPGAPRARVRP